MAELSQAELDYIGMVFQKAQEMYPQLAWALKIPELAKIIVQGAQEQWDDGRIEAALQNTEWWKSRDQAAREWAVLYNTDPKQAERQTTEYRTLIQGWASQNGITLSSAQLTEVTNWATALKFNQQQIAAYIIDHFKPQGDFAAPVGDQLQQMAADYLVPLSSATLQQWEAMMLKGEANQETFASYLREQAKSLFPSLGNFIDRGGTVVQYIQPYQEIAIQELGVNPAAIDWRDPKWRTAIDRIDPGTGQHTAMSLSDWQRELRTNTIYGFDQTQRAQEQATTLSQALLERFGRAA